MYNRYIPQEDYGPIPPGQTETPPRAGGGLGELLRGLLRGGGDGDQVSRALSALLEKLGLRDLDAGDILLGLIAALLILEDGDDLELLIALALAFLLRPGET